jgi:hypothetical protein
MGQLSSSVDPQAANDLTPRDWVLDKIAEGGGVTFDAVLEQTITVPGSPSAGARYLIGPNVSSGPGAWQGKANNIAQWDGSAWVFTAPVDGGQTFVRGGSGDFADGIVRYTDTTSPASWVLAGNLSGALVASLNLSDIASASAARGNLGLGTLATQSSVSLSTDVSGVLGTSNGGTGAALPGDARTNLGLVIGTDVQAQDAGLQAIAALPTTDGGFIVGNGSTFVSENGATARTSLGLGTAAVEGVATSLSTTASKILKVASSNLASGDFLKMDSAGLIVAGAAGTGTVTSITPAGDNGNGSAITTSATLSVLGGEGIDTSVSGTILTVSGEDATVSNKGVASFATANFVVASGAVSIKSGGVDLTDEVTGTLPAGNGGTGLTSIATLLNSNVTPTSLGLVIGTNVQAYDADLTALAGISSADGNFIVGSASGWVPESGATVRTSLGLGTAATYAVSTGLTPGTLPSISSSTPAPSAAVALNSSGQLIAASISSTDVTGYGTFTAPIKVAATYLAASSAVTAAPSSISVASEEYVYDLSALSATSSFVLPAPAAGDVGKSIRVKVLGGMSSANKMTITVSGGDKFDGLATIDFEQNYATLDFMAIQAGTGAGINAYRLAG